jgi:hypothetical protein
MKKFASIISLAAVLFLSFDVPQASLGWSYDGSGRLGIDDTIRQAAPTAVSSLIISEFRFRGPGGDLDEFVELYNNSDSPLTVAASDASAGFALVASDGAIRFTIPNGTVIPARGHFLGANTFTGGYSLSTYAAPNTTYTADIPDYGGIALFNNATPANFTLANRFDAVGESTAPALYREGAGFPAPVTGDFEYSYARQETANCAAPFPLDTNNNVNDFRYSDTQGTFTSGVTQRLGAPGPQNLASPIGPSGASAGFTRSRLDTAAALGASPNFVRSFTSNPGNNSTFGTITIRRTFTNNTGAPITRLRFRVTQITTFPSPGGDADLRPINSADTVVATSGGNVTVRGTTLEQPPTQPNGGGVNSSYNVPFVTAGAPLAPGASIPVQFLLGIQATGIIRLGINVEALPIGDGARTWFFTYNTDPMASTMFQEACSFTAASVSISGRVNSASRATVTMTDASGEVRTALVNPFGYYKFEGITAGQTVVIQAAAKGATFTPQVINVTQDVEDLNFTAL